MRPGIVVVSALGRCRDASHRLNWCIFAAGFCALVLVTAGSQGSLAFGAAGQAQSASFTLDNVTVSVQSPFLPTGKFGTSQPGDASQVATDATLIPYQEFSVTAVPIGKVPGTEQLPKAAHGGEGAYRSALAQ